MSKARIVAKAIAFALYRLNVGETISNSGEVINELLHQAGVSSPNPWCVATTNFICATTCAMLGLTPPIKIGASSSVLHVLASAAGLLIDFEDIQSGDIMILRGGPTGWKHTGFVYEVVDNGIWVIEGNISNKIVKSFYNNYVDADFVRYFDA